MSRPARIIAAGALCALGAALGVQRLATLRAAEQQPQAAPAWLPAAQARPAELAFADTLRRGETLSELLDRTRLDLAATRALLEQLAQVQDPRTVRPGLVVEYRRSTRTGAVRAVSTRLDADRRLSLRPAGAGWDARVEEVQVHTDTTVLAGSVRRSLYQALMDGEGDVPRGERQRVADLLADSVFPWQIDFSRDLKVGDTFRILYERMVRPDGSARSSRILAVQFDIDGRAHDAYRFTVDGLDEFYDGDGESLKRAFLRAPLEFRRISSVFTSGRFHPILRRVRAHQGIDYAASMGTPVRAVGDGVIARAGWAGGYGNLVEIRHQRGYGSRYGHMRGFAPGIRPGVRVRQGQLIGFVGTTGLSTGPHLHYEFHMDGRPVDPSSIRYLTGAPIPGGAKGRFRAARDLRTAALERVSGPRLAKRDSARTGDRG
jgi:murein DD-endopeptidase MepM/ murein hydrolase activator NlpD